jgi:TPR repeat protein
MSDLGCEISEPYPQASAQLAQLYEDKQCLGDAAYWYRQSVAAGNAAAQAPLRRLPPSQPRRFRAAELEALEEQERNSEVCAGVLPCCCAGVLACCRAKVNT